MPVHRSPRRPPLALAVALCVLGGLLSVGLAAAQDEGVEDLRQAREQNRSDAAEVAAELDALAAEDDELAAAIAALEAHIALQQTQVAAAEEAIADAEERARLAREQAEALEAEADLIRRQLELAAIDAFVAPRPDVLGRLDNENLLDVELTDFYVEEVVGDEYELIDQLRVAQDSQVDAIRRADEATVEAETERDGLAARLVELDADKARVEELRARVAARIDEWEAVGREIDAADAAIAAQIRELEAELARQAAEAEAARRAEEERLLAEGPSDDAESPGDDAPGPPVVTGPFSVTHRPVPGAVTSGFGSRIHPIFGTARNHYGVDFNGSSGDPIGAAAAGQVITAGWMNGYGNVVILSHGEGYTTLYAHLSAIGVGTGDTVAGGATIGRVGSTGWSTGPHLHWEIRINGAAVDPMPYL